MTRKRRRTDRKPAGLTARNKLTPALAAFAEAVRHHQAGRLDLAEPLYRKAIGPAPGYVEAYYNLGILLTARGRRDEAIASYRGAIEARPDYPGAHNNLGILLGDSGMLEEAVAAYRAALACRPDYPEALNNLGNVLRSQGRLDEAVASFRGALALRPSYPEADNNLGIVLREQDLPEEAMACHRRAIALKPAYPEAHNNLGIVLKEQGRLEEAAACYRAALEIAPNYPEAHNNLGIVLKEQGRFEEAVASYGRALAIAPHYPEALNNLGITWQQQGRIDEAIACYQKAIAVSPGFHRSYSNLGTAFQEQFRLEEAVASYRKAIALQPDDAEAHNNLAMALLTQGDLTAGWEENEWRWRTPPMRKVERNFTQPQWRGEPGDGRTLLIHAEQGFGDTLQFCRYAPLAAERGFRVIVEVPRPLQRLMRGLRVVDRVLQDGEALPDFDVHCPMLSLPLAFGTTLETIPASVPYLYADSGQVAAWRARLTGTEGKRVGLVWAGNPNNLADRRRSLQPDRLAPLFGLPGVAFFSLQKDGGASDELGLTDFMDEMEDFADTAALIANLDLVISVDTAVAHLAAALGKPVWLLDRFDPDWRWLTDRRDSPWYKTLRLFRQPAPGDWAPVVAEVRAELLGFEPAPDIHGLFAGAVRRHQAGQLAEAEGLYQQVLAALPRHAGSLHLLGVIAGQTGRHDLAIDLIGKAIAIDPGAAAYHTNLGVSLRQLKRLGDAVASFRTALALAPDDAAARNALEIALREQDRPDEAVAQFDLGNALKADGRLDEAIACYRRSIGLNPAYKEAHNNLGIALRVSGRLDEAIDCYRSAIALDAGYTEAHNNLGIALQKQERLEEAIASYRAALALKPDSPEALSNMGSALWEQRRVDEAVACYRQSIAPRPDQQDAHTNLGAVLKEHGPLEEAVAAYRKAIEANPNFAEARSNLGTALKEQGRLDEAVAEYRRAIEISPNFADAHSNLGAVLDEQGLLAEATAAYRRAIALRPDYVEAHSNLAMALLAQGDMAAGWAEYEWRLKSPRVIKAGRSFVQPQWRGEAAEGRTLLIHAEQGFGDTLQFCRYAPMAAALGLRVVMEVPAPLVRLMRGLPGVDRVVATCEALPAFDLHCPMLSLPLALGTTLESIPGTVPYLHAGPAQVAAWRTRLAATDGARIGLVWAGSARNHLPAAAIIDRRRSIAPERLAPLFEVPGLHFFSLQKDGPAAPEQFPLIDFMGEMEDFAGTAALIVNLDLVISVDTAVAHLAAALGRPVWLLDRFDACWRWLRGRRDSPWYPALRIFRQPAPGDWDSVLEEVRRELSGFAPDRAPDLFGAAVGHHRAGRLAEAGTLYRRVLEAEPNHADSLHLLGVIAGQSGQHDRAVELIRRAIAIDPGAAHYHGNLGVSMKQQNRLGEAVASFRTALDLRPDDPEARHRLDVALQEQGRTGDPAAHFARASILKAQGQIDDAIASYRAALALSVRPRTLRVFRVGYHRGA